LQRASKLSHPNLFHLLPGGRWQLAEMDLGFVVMEYAEETWDTSSLSVRSQQKRLAKCSASSRRLKYIHSKGFAHSHIKPSNIMAMGDHLKLAFDTVLPLGEPRPTYRPVDAYDAPEAGTAPVAGAGDVWSLGMTLVETLTQHPPASSPENQADPIVPPTLPNLSSTSRDTVCAAIPHSAGPQNRSRTVLTRLRPGSRQGSRTGCCPCGKKDRTAAEMWQDIHYTWVVLCKNYFFHMQQNLFFRHRIPSRTPIPSRPFLMSRPFQGPVRWLR